MNLSSGVLVQRCREGDTKALAELFSLHRGRLLRMVHFRLDHRLVGRIGPEDILQEAYLNACKRIRHFLEEANQNVFVWLRLIVRQTLVDIHRHYLNAAKRDINREVSLYAAYAQPSTSQSFAGQLPANVTPPSQAAIRNETYLQLEQAIAALPEIDREVLLLRHFEELTNSEVAEELGIGVTAASNRYIRAVARLKKAVIGAGL